MTDFGSNDMPRNAKSLFAGPILDAKQSAVYLDDLLVSLPGCVVERRASLDVLDVDDGALLEQEVGRRVVVVAAGEVEGTNVVLTLFDVHVCNHIYNRIYKRTHCIHICTYNGIHRASMVKNFYENVLDV